jgi:hypothetical protein
LQQGNRRQERQFRLKTIFVFVLAAVAAHGSTMVFVTPPGSTISSGTISVNAQVTFITSQNQIEIRVANLQQEQGSVAQTISAVDWSFGSAIPVLPTQTARSGDMITLNSGSGNTQVGYTKVVNGYATYSTDRWHQVFASTQISGGMEITALSGSNPDETIIGPPNASNLYQSNGGLRGDNPFLQTALGSYISWTFSFAPSDNITAATQVARVRTSFNTAFAATTELDLVLLTPEPGTPFMLLGGIAGLCFWRARKRKAAR